MKKPIHEKLDEKIAAAPRLFGQAAANVTDTLALAALAYKAEFGEGAANRPELVIRLLELMMHEAERLAGPDDDGIPL